MDRARWLIFRWTSSLKHWLTTRFTLPGQLALGALTGAAVWGVDTTQSMDYQLFTLFLSLLLLAMLQARFFRAKARAVRILPRFGTAGQPLPYTTVVENLGKRVERGLTVLEDLPDPRPAYQEFHAEPETSKGRMDRWAGFSRWRRLIERKRMAMPVSPVGLPDLPPGGKESASGVLQPTRRGRLELPSLSIGRPDTLGLYRESARQALPQSVLILPKRYPVPNPALPGLRRYQQGGVALSSSVGDSQEFMGLRDYRPGDPIRRVHWRSWARVGKPVVKEYEDEYFTRHALALDTFVRPGQEDAFEEAVSVAASFACSTMTQESLLDLLFVADQSYCFTAGRGLGGADKLLEVLACARACTDKSFEELAASMVSRRTSLSGALLVLLGWDEPRKKLVAGLKGSGLSVLALVVTDDEIDAAGLPVKRLVPGRIGEGLAAL